MAALIHVTEELFTQNFTVSLAEIKTDNLTTFQKTSHSGLGRKHFFDHVCYMTGTSKRLLQLLQHRCIHPIGQVQ